jgi:hypothetical protein
MPPFVLALSQLCVARIKTRHQAGKSQDEHRHAVNTSM